jgi:hypothetical protein
MPKLKHITAVVLVLLSLMYVLDGDYSKSALIDYSISVVVILLFVYMYGRLLRQTRKDIKR